MSLTFEETLHSPGATDGLMICHAFSRSLRPVLARPRLSNPPTPRSATYLQSKPRQDLLSAPRPRRKHRPNPKQLHHRRLRHRPRALTLPAPARPPRVWTSLTGPTVQT